MYRENYFTSEEPGRGHRDFESENAHRYDIVKFGHELDDIIGLPTGNKRLLDFGAATGSFLLIAEKYGWRAIGVEPSEAARDIAKSKGLRCVSSLQEVPGGELFEVITMHHVVEHLVFPVRTLEDLRATLSPSGIVLIEVPNWRCGERIAMGSSWIDLRPEQHRWHFTPRTLAYLCDLAGFDVIRIGTLGEPIPALTSVLRSVGLPIPSLTSALRSVGLPYTVGARPGANKLQNVASTMRRALASKSAPLIVRTAWLVDAVLDRLHLGKRLYVVARQKKPSA